MMRAIVMLCCAAGIARAGDSFDVPPGYVEGAASGEASLAEFRAQRAATVSADITTFTSPDGRVTVVRMRWKFWLGEELSRAALEHVDHEIESDIAEEMLSNVKLVSSSRRFIGDQLAAQSTHELSGRQFRMRRLYAVDAFGFMHMFALACGGPADQLGYCDAAQRTMKLTVPYQLPLSELPKYGERPRPPVTWSIGHTIGTAVLIALIVGLGSWIYTSARRRDRRRRRRR